jgi:hypothetical protein
MRSRCSLAHPVEAGDPRKHDKRDAIQLARLYPAGELMTIHIPTEAEESACDLVRCRETFERESSNYILKFLRRRRFVCREGQNWMARHFDWLRRLYTETILSRAASIEFSSALVVCILPICDISPSWRATCVLLSRAAARLKPPRGE